MEEFFIGLHQVSDAWPFHRSMIQVSRLEDRVSDFRVNEWILDSGAFSQISRSGKFTMNADQYLEHIARWAKCGTLRAAIVQDWMCEPFVLSVTGKSMGEHQRLTIESYGYLRDWSDNYIMPVLQGYEPRDYVDHLHQYGDLLEREQWVGVGSVCKRNGTPDAIEDVLLAIKSNRGDLRLHGFGLKIQAFERPTIRDLLYSADSMAWSTAGRKQNGNANDPRDALRYAAKIQALIKQPVFVQEQLFGWWS